MITFLVFLTVLAGVVYRATTPEQRTQFAGRARTELVHAWRVIEERRRQPDPFRAALRARTAWAVVTPTLVALNVGVFVAMVFGDGTLADPETLVAWGGNFGPRTTNGEWWRLATSMFVHRGLMQLLIDVFALLQIGLLLERLVGRIAFAATYASAGVAAALLRVSASPTDVIVGSSGAIFGVFGLLLAALIWGVFRRSTLTVPLRTLKRLTPAVGLFLLYNGLQGSPEHAGFVVGFGAGVFLARGIGDGKPRAKRVLITAGATAVILAAAWVPIRGVTDIRPELARVVDVERRTASAYETARARFTAGSLKIGALIELIEQTIMPELGAARARLQSLDGVPDVHRPLVTHADQYFQMRDESWRLRAQGLRKTNTLALRKAEATERESLLILEKLTPTPPK